MTQEQFEALGIEKSLAKKAADESKKELEGYVAKESFLSLSGLLFLFKQEWFAFF